MINVFHGDSIKSFFRSKTAFVYIYFYILVFVYTYALRSAGRSILSLVFYFLEPLLYYLGHSVFFCESAIYICVCIMWLYYLA